MKITKKPKASVAADAEGLDHIAKKRSIIRQHKARAQFKFAQHSNLVNFAVAFWHF